jgi:hypothetical protein
MLPKTRSFIFSILIRFDGLFTILAHSGLSAFQTATRIPHTFVHRIVLQERKEALKRGLKGTSSEASQ